ncbi:hypothetical protein Tco_1018178 [Tanacetum coccineum]|uniref:Aspartic peptidase DDI1-type domain-containing protein n=1 Tax=Tanacetum coccineum TaxID=301880 RepID=A0ABQ5FV21_9ASTR
MNPRCSALRQNQLPPKEQDLESFILPCSIRRLDFNNALADLGASISVMPLSMYKSLGIGKLEPINMVIEMADNTKCTPKGIVENLLIKIDKFIFPVDFVILDMVEDLRMPINLGRPLLATAHTKESYEEAVYRMTEQEDSWKTKKMDEANLEQYQDLIPVEKPKVHCHKPTQLIAVIAGNTKVLQGPVLSILIVSVSLKYTVSPCTMRAFEQKTWDLDVKFIQVKSSRLVKA